MADCEIQDQVIHGIHYTKGKKTKQSINTSTLTSVNLNALSKQNFKSSHNETTANYTIL